ncbi:MAG: hypothetical protein ACD_79C01416G0003 [uncultured bacterium]|nr:MAG: hypothetical protein ACD_79C01416G0003 [uncultured bacterium]
MRKYIVIGLCFICLTLLIFEGYISIQIPKNERPDVALQFQRSDVLTANRYIAILMAFHDRNFENIQNDIDWWLDISIIQLQILEERYPKGNWGDVILNDSPQFTMKTLYKRIAQYRKDNPRRHSYPLDEESIKRIKTFVEKYK